MSGLLGVTVANYLDAVRDGGYGADAEADAFVSLTRAHRAAIRADETFMWCLGRLGGDPQVVATAVVADRCAHWLDEAYGALERARRPPSRWRTLLGPARRPGEPPLHDRARDYAHAAMAHSEQVEHLRALLADAD